ncbi:MAG: amino acid adenylation domain-containing protein, partial [Chitinophagaceae bacterium]|nr:amino acid adenylation domain-containing protein [Chitinophagaceae bacterium]
MASQRFPLHPAQQDIYLDQLLERNSPHYNIGGYIRLTGRLDKDILKMALKSVPEVFDAFHMGFDIDGDHPCFYYISGIDYHEFKELDFSTGDLPHVHAREWMRAQFNIPFRLGKGERPTELYLLKISDYEHWFFNKYHHLITDGFGFAIWAKYVALKYSKLNAGDTESIKYPAYFEECDIAGDYYRSAEYTIDGDYWKDKFREKPVKFLRRNYDLEGPPVKKVGNYVLHLSREQQDRLRQSGDVTKAGLQQLTIAALGIYFGKTSSCPTLCFGVNIHKRRTKRSRNTVGVFSGILPCRTWYDPDTILKDFLRDIAKDQKEDYRHQSYLMGDLLRYHKVGAAENFMDLMVNYERLDFSLDFGPELKATTHELNSDYSKYPLQVWWKEYGDQQALELCIGFQYEYFSQEEAELLAARILFLIEQFSDGLLNKIGTFEIIPSQERRKIEADFKAGRKIELGDQTVIGLFRQMVRSVPERIAIEIDDDRMTYGELGSRCDLLASRLLRAGLEKGEFVPLFSTRSIDTVVGILAIMTSGGVYVPLDPSSPAERILFILADCKPGLVLGRKAEIDLLPKEYQESGIEFVPTDEVLSGRKEVSPETGLLSPEDRAYCIYTSGTSGNPKGVIIQHAGLVNVALDHIQEFRLTEHDRYLQFMSPFFDGSLLDIFTALLSGATLVLVRQETILKPELFLSYIEAHRVSIITVTPSYLGLLEQAEMPSVRILVSAGEACRVKDATYYSRTRQFYNGYGPTEGAVNTTLYKVDPERQYAIIPIGRPSANKELYILLNSNELAPTGVVGELCIAGTGLASGYLNQEQLTASSFVNHPFGGAKMYRSGDLARWLPDGNLEFAGRADDQVKIGGFRIEPREIEQALAAHPRIEQCVALPVSLPDRPDKSLTLFYKLREDMEFVPSLGEHDIYDEFIYRSMAQDPMRVEGYKAALRDKVGDKVVLDPGTGTEMILARRSVESGAAKVYAVEILEDAYLHAKDRLVELGLQDKIILVHGNARDVTLPEPIDVIVSAVAGNIASSDGCIRMMTELRTRFGRSIVFIPDRYLTRIAAVELPETIYEAGFSELSAHHIRAVREKYGFATGIRMCIRHFSAEYILSSAAVAEEITYASPCPEFEDRHVVLDIHKAGFFHGLLLWINVFSADELVIDSLKKTHHLPVYFPVLQEPMEVGIGMKIQFTFRRSAGMDGVHPDYHVMGTVTDKDGRIRKNFSYSSCHVAVADGQDLLQLRLFGPDRTPRVRDTLDPAMVKSHLAAKLPPFMLPHQLLEVDAWPLTANGKVDRGRLLEQAGVVRQAKPDILPGDPFIEKMSEIWVELLGIDKIDAKDDFFNLGGHSLLAVRLVTGIRKVFGIEIGIGSIFDYPTLAGLSAYIAGQIHADRADTIQPEVRPADVPLSFGQEQLWFTDQLEGSVQYHIPLALELKGKLDQGVLQQALRIIVNRHEALRTVILPGNGRPFQSILGEDKWSLEVIDGSMCKTFPEKLHALAKERSSVPFDLSKDHKMRGCLIVLDDNEYLLLLILHHIAADGWSSGILLKELTVIYGSLLKGEQPQLTPLPIQYADYSIWEKRQLQENRQAAHLSYWKERLEGIGPLDLPTDHERPSVKSMRGRGMKINLDKGLTERLRDFSKQEGVTLFMTMLAAFKVLLHRYSGQDDIAVGTPVSGRGRQELEGMIGYLVNTLVLRDNLGGNPCFRALLQKIRQTTAEAYDHQEVPFGKVVEALLKERDPSRSPLFQVMFDLKSNQDMIDFQLGGVLTSWYLLSHTTSKFDIGVSLEESNGRIQGGVEYCTDVYEEETIRRMLRHYESLLDRMMRHPEQNIDDLVFLSEEELRYLSDDLSGRNAAARPGGVAVRFSMAAFLFQQLRTETGHTATVYKNQKTSYHELDKVTDKLARYIGEKSPAVAGQRVVVLVDRSEWILISLLAIWKCGAVYVPVDNGFPLERILFILNDVQPALVITEQTLLAFVERHGYHAITPDGLAGWQPVCTICEEQEQRTEWKDTDEAYIIYTSGSSGAPKGVVVTHGNVNHFFSHLKGACPDLSRPVVPFMASCAFDISLFQLLFPLLLGGTTETVDKEQLQNLDGLLKTLRGVTVIDAVPGMYRMILNHIEETNLTSSFGHVQRIFIGGDSIPDDLLGRLGGIFTNAIITVTYGPTEATIFCTQLDYVGGGSQDGSIIGRPIAGAEIYIADEHSGLCPVGVFGEICIGGDSVSGGYWRHPDLNKEKFSDNLFRQGSRIYRTGDVGRWKNDGMLEFRNRKDAQIKVNGYRIEPGEIEYCIRQHRYVTDAVVMPFNTSNAGRSIIGYFTERSLIQVWPSISEYLGYNDIAYLAMNNDPLRANSYKEAIAGAVRGKIVVDVGTGPEAILAQYCLEQGATKVYAIEIIEEVYHRAKAVIEANGLQDRIILILGDVMEVELPEKVDICVCALVGNMGSSDGCIPIMNRARTFLKDPARMIPCRSVVKIAAVSWQERDIEYAFTKTGAYYIENIFSLSGRSFDLRIGLQNVDSRHVVSSWDIFEDLDLTKQLAHDDEHDIVLEVGSDCRINGLLVWLNLYTGPSILNDIFQSQKSFLPIYLPVFNVAPEVHAGDQIHARIRRMIPSGDVYPDYYIDGEVIRPGRENISFNFLSRRQETAFGGHPFYRQVFPGGEIRIKEPFSAELLKQYLRSQLPEYMVPSQLVELEEIPLTANGKVDRRRLPDPGLSESSRGYEAPRTETERVLAGIWSGLLGRERIGVNDNFFEIGGDSIISIQVVSRARRQGYELQPRDLFLYQTIGKLSAVLSSRG